MTYSNFGSWSNCLKVTVKHRNPERLTLKIQVKDIYDWLKFDGLTSLVDLQSHAKMAFLSFANLKKLQIEKF